MRGFQFGRARPLDPRISTPSVPLPDYPAETGKSHATTLTLARSPTRDSGGFAGGGGHRLSGYTVSVSIRATTWTNQRGKPTARHQDAEQIYQATTAAEHAARKCPRTKRQTRAWNTAATSHTR